MLSTTLNVLLMIAGFGLIIAIHELGHFLAARWAGIRVHAFAIGFGSALFSWRKGMGLSAGSSEARYRKMCEAWRTGASRVDPSAISPTEYRLNWFPFGGYVKMHGQEDLSPITESSDDDSFAAKPVWKRMIVISGGVAMNIVLAAVLFLIAYKLGVREVTPIIGDIGPNSPAQQAGLQPGDRVVRAGDHDVATFNDLFVTVAMARAGEPMNFVVERAGEAAPLTIAATPTRGSSGLLQIGVAPAPGLDLPTLKELRSPDSREQFTRMLTNEGLADLRPGMRLVAVNGEPLAPGSTALALRSAVESSRGMPVHAEFQDQSGASTHVKITPRPEYQFADVPVGTSTQRLQHLLGFTPLLAVEDATADGAAKGLRTGDIFAQVGSVAWPSVIEGIAEIRAHAGRDIDLVVLRDGERVELTVAVDRNGRVGFAAGTSAATSTLLARTPDALADTPAGRLIPQIVPGSRIVRVSTPTVQNFAELRQLLSVSRGMPFEIELTLELPATADAAPVQETVPLLVSVEDAEAIEALGWQNDRALSMFNVAEFVDIASSPWDALVKGTHKTIYAVQVTYLTFARLFQGSVPVSQLQGPVGITHTGSIVAEQGWPNFLVFLGLISANLAVVNFLPLPITDGGHMIFLTIEAITRRPVSVAIQNIATIAGMALIGTMFLIVTFNDVVRLLGMG
jgi:regulator of sigma E protease